MFDFFKKILEYFSSVPYISGFDVRHIPEDTLVYNIKPYKYHCYADESLFAVIYTVELTEGDVPLIPFLDQNGRVCVENDDGIIYRIK